DVLPEEPHQRPQMFVEVLGAAATAARRLERRNPIGIARDRRAVNPRDGARHAATAPRALDQDLAEIRTHHTPSLAGRRRAVGRGAARRDAFVHGRRAARRSPTTARAYGHLADGRPPSTTTEPRPTWPCAPRGRDARAFERGRLSNRRCGATTGASGSRL